MGKLIKWLKNKIRGSSSSGSSSTVPAKIETSEVEKQIDLVIFFNLSKCENLLRLNPNMAFWQSVVKAICFAESSFNQYETFWESMLGTPKGYDSKTKMKYMSEGLMQLSYSDAVYHQCEFDIEGDRPKKSDDKTKTIFNIEKNIKCGLKILDKLVGIHGHYIFNSGNYWAVLKPSNKRHSVFVNKFNQYISHI